MTEKFKQPYSLIRSRRRTLALEIKAEGGLLVRAPKHLPLPVIERFIDSKSSWIHKHLTKIKPEPALMELQQENKLRAAARRDLPELTRVLSDRMGVRPSYVRITSARKRLGSCNAKGGVCFSFRLMAYPAEVIDYVVVHELAHLVHLNHSAEFYQVIARAMPDFRERIKMMIGFMPGC